MKKIITAFSLFCFLFVYQSKASHIAGGDLSYVCLGGNQYQINLNLFVDCLGFDPGTVQTIEFESTCGGTATTTVNILNPGGTEISQLCPTQINNSTCNGGSLPGMWVFHYTGVVTLAPQCNTWTMSWNVCCRNAAIENLINPDSFGSYIEATMNSSTDSCNNSPAFTAQPIPYVCQGQLVNYSYGVVETDGDSLYYSLVNALDFDFASGGPINLAYAAGYSASSPIPGITIDGNTGMLTFTPTMLGNFVVVVLVQEYDSNGNLLGTVMRDIQFIVQSCTNSVPDPAAGAITGMTGTAVQTGPFSIELCEGSNFTFTATYTDVNAADNLTVISNIGTVLPGSTLSTSGTNPLTATISWTAPAGSANTNTTFSVTINDGACPVPGQQTFVYDIQVQPRTLAGPDQIICGPQSASMLATGGSVFTWSVISGPPMVVGTNFSCNPCDNPVATPSATTTYEVTSDLSGTCVNKDTITINVVPDFSFTTTQSTATLCLQQSVQFEITGSPAGTYTYLWSPAATLDNTTIFNPTATLNAAGTYNYYVNITSPDGCLKKDTVTAIVQPAIRTIANPDTVLCEGQSANLSATGGTSFTWTVLSGPAIVVGTNFSCVNCATPVATPASTTTYIVTSDLTGTCINTDTVTVTVVPDYTVITTQSTTTTCLTNPVQLNTTVNPAGTYSYLWSPSTNLDNATIPNPVATTAIPGTYSYILTTTNSLGCVKLDTTTVVILPSAPPDPQLTYTSAACLGDSIVLSANFGFPVPTVCGIDTAGCIAPLTATIGNQTGSNTTTTWPAIFGNWYTSEKHQMLFRASELQAAGLTGGRIDQIDIPVLSLSGITTYHQFTISMGCTNLNALNGTWVGGLFQVFTPSTVNIAVGMNTFLLTNTFEWDGVSNIVVEICSTEGPGAFGYSNYTTSSVSPYTTTTFTSCMYSFTDMFDMCPDQTNFITQTTNRPILKFHYCNGAPDISNFTFDWSPDPLLQNPASQTTAAFVPGDTTYTVVVTDGASGCTGTSSINVTAIAPTTFNLTVSNDTVVCPGTPTTITASGATSYVWSPAGSLSSSTVANPVATPTVTTTYTVTASTPCAPSIVDSITVTAVNSVVLNVNAGNDTTICPGTPTTLNASGATSYSWSPGTGLSSTTVSNPVASPTTTITYTVTGTAFCANPVIDSVTVFAVNSVVLNVNAGNDVTICPGSPTTLNATGATNYSWSPPLGLSSTTVSNPTASPMTTTTYTVVGTAACADPASDVVTVSAVNSVILVVSAGVDQTICPGSPAVLTATGATNYTWSPPTDLSTTSGATTTSTAASTITYTVTGTGPCANPVQDSVTVNVLTASALNINAGADGTVCVGEPISLNATTTGGFAGNVYDWTVFSGYLADSVINSNSLNASVMATHEGLNMYEITVIDLCGNMASDTVVYDVTNDCELTIPNIFTPNGDGNNDMFFVNGSGIVTYSLSIFDRWGKKVFETSDIAKGWDGGGNSDGTYYYILRAEMRNSKEVDKQGYIQLLSN